MTVAILELFINVLFALYLIIFLLSGMLNLVEDC